MKKVPEPIVTPEVEEIRQKTSKSRLMLCGRQHPKIPHRADERFSIPSDLSPLSIHCLSLFMLPTPPLQTQLAFGQTCPGQRYARPFLCEMRGLPPFPRRLLTLGGWGRGNKKIRHPSIYIIVYIQNTVGNLLRLALHAK